MSLYKEAFEQGVQYGRQKFYEDLEKIGGVQKILRSYGGSKAVKELTSTRKGRYKFFKGLSPKDREKIISSSARAAKIPRDRNFPAKFKAVGGSEVAEGLEAMRKPRAIGRLPK